LNVAGEEKPLAGVTPSAISGGCQLRWGVGQAISVPLESA